MTTLQFIFGTAPQGLTGTTLSLKPNKIMLYRLRGHLAPLNKRKPFSGLDPAGGAYGATIPYLVGWVGD